MKNSLNKYSRYLLKCSYKTAKWLYQYDLNKRISKLSDFILVYQMGKVGSSSVVKSIRAMDIPAYNVHTFNPVFLERTEAQFKQLWKTAGPTPVTLWDEQYFARYIRSNIKNKRKIISLVRDPAARNISLFFQYPNMILEPIKNGYHIQSINFDYDITIKYDFVVDELYELFQKKMVNHKRPLVWFDEEVKRYFGLDVYSKPFPKEKGYSIYRSDLAELLLIKLEKINDVFPAAIDEFLDIKGASLLTTNLGEKKDTANIYKQFLSVFIPEEEYLDELYGSKFSNHFYSEKELETFKSKWLKNTL